MKGLLLMGGGPFAKQLIDRAQNVSDVSINADRSVNNLYM